ncbi:MAG: hypothetical protein H6742_19855 [Alphaproteobacteria bacterium]|nr:hypothetical protein [Alphaproteobacteria bacterium]
MARIEVRVVGIVGLALALRLLRVPARWATPNLLYASYPSHTADALAAGDLLGALPFSGLHPPLWPLLHALTELFAPVPLLWLCGSALASTAAVALLARRSWLAALLLATSPLQLAYAAEINDYPLAVCLVAACIAARAPAEQGRWGWLAAAGALAAWTHVLAGLAAGLVALGLRDRFKVLGVMALCCLPLVPGVVEVLGVAGTFRQPPVRPALIVPEVVSRFGLMWLGFVPAWIAGLRKAPWLLGPTLGLGGFVAFFIAIGIGAPHQFPYWLLLGPGLALAASFAGPLARRLAVVTALLHALLPLRPLPDLLALPDGERAIDLALAELDAPWTCDGAPSPACSGDALYLLITRRADDDDKRPLDPTLWRLAPWRALPRVQPFDGAWDDYRNGNPRLAGDHVVYVDDWARERVATVVAAHRRTFVVVTDTDATQPTARDMASWLGAEPQVVGPDLLFRVERGD